MGGDLLVVGGLHGYCHVDVLCGLWDYVALLICGWGSGFRLLGGIHGVCHEGLDLCGWWEWGCWFGLLYWGWGCFS